MLKIQRTNSDNPDFDKLTQQLDSLLCEIYGTRKEDFEEYNCIVDLDTVVLAYFNNEPVGCACFKKFNDDSIEIKRMYVVPRYRKQGIASRILYEIETWAVGLNYTYAILETGNKQPEAIELYQNLGYTITGNYVEMGHSVCMIKSLWS